jgi:GTPase
VPGTTRDSIEVPFAIGEGPSARCYTLIDTAGMRKVGRVHDSVERFSVFRAEKSIERADVVVLMLDAADGPTVQDKKIATKILEDEKGCILLVNKWDLAGEVTQKEYAEALRRALPFLAHIPLLFVSAKSGVNMRNSVDAIDQVAAQVSTKLPTGVLNRVMHDAFERVQPPLIQGRRLKLYYTTQVSERPIRIALFVNDPKRVTDSYRAFLIGALRRAFGLEGAPVKLFFRSSHAEKEDAGARRKRR